MLDAPAYPGAQPAEREYDFALHEQRLRMHEWGDRRAQPLVLTRSSGTWSET